MSVINHRTRLLVSTFLWCGDEEKVQIYLSTLCQAIKCRLTRCCVSPGLFSLMNQRRSPIRQRRVSSQTQEDRLTELVIERPLGELDLGQPFKRGEPEMPFLVKLAAEYGIEFLSGPPS
jgi:hypothetical protein